MMEIIEWLQHFPTARYISELCKRCIDEKWYKGSTKPVLAGCPFCDDDDERCGETPYACKFCYCPPDICNEQCTGLVHEIEDYFHEEEGDDEDEDENEMIVALLPDFILLAMQYLLEQHVLPGG